MDSPGRVTVGMGQPHIPRRSTLPLLVGGVAALLVGVGAAALFTGGEQAEQPDDAHLAKPAGQADAPAVAPETPNAQPPAAHPPPEPQPEPEAPPPRVTISSEPAGAELYQGSVLLGNTPFPLNKPSGKDKLDLELRLSGYKDKSFVITARTGDTLKLSLSKDKARRPRPKAETTETKPKPQPAPGRRVQTEVLDPWD
jgi:serine/threonine-protein kinase